MTTKNLLTASLLTASLLVTGTVFANTEWNSGNKTIYTDAYTSEAAAYEAGFDIIDDLSQSSRNELKSFLRIRGRGVRDIEIDQTKVQIEAFATDRNLLQYRALVSIDYKYEAREDD